MLNSLDLRNSRSERLYALVSEQLSNLMSLQFQVNFLLLCQLLSWDLGCRRKHRSAGAGDGGLPALLLNV